MEGATPSLVAPVAVAGEPPLLILMIHPASMTHQTVAPVHANATTNRTMEVVVRHGSAIVTVAALPPRLAA